MAPPKRSLPLLQPKPPGSQADEQDPALALTLEGLPRKRRAVSSACNNCRKKKVKCDSARPRCGPCTSRDLPCEFVDPEDSRWTQAKRQQLAKYESVFDLIRRGSPAESMAALQRIRDAHDVEAAINSIAEAQLLMQMPSSSSAASVPGNNAPRGQQQFKPLGSSARRLPSPFDDPGFMFEKQYMADARDQAVDSDMFVDIASRDLPLSRWTTASDDDRYMNHLLTLFFTWDNIVERACYRPIFEEDVVNADPSSADDNPGSFCTRFLVNALLAASCLFTLDQITFTDPQDPTTRGRRWADEAEALLEDVDRPSLPLLQGLYSLFVYEGVIGSGTKSVHYFLRSMDVYKELNEAASPRQQEGTDKARLARERQAASWCMWGFYCCEWRSSQAFGFRKLARKPRAEREWCREDFPLRQSGCIGYWWFPYPMSLQAQRSLQVEVREVDVMLSEIVEEALDFIYPEEGGLPPQASPDRALEIYDRFAEWKLSCPSRIRFEEATLPSAILLHIGVDVMFTALLRPFSHMTEGQFGRFDPRERCFAHASSLVSEIWTFRAFAHLRFEYWLSHVLGTAAYVVVREAEDAPIQMDTLIRACQCLHEMRPSFPIATDVLAGIFAAFKRYRLQVPSYMRRYFDTVRHREDGLLHHAVAALLPDPTEVGRIGSGAELQLQELLDEFDGVGID